MPDKPGVAASIFKAIAAEAINVDMIVQNVGHDGTTDLSFTAPREDVPRLGDVLDRSCATSVPSAFTLDEGIAKLSLVGAGMKSHPGVAADMFDVLAGEGVNIEMISTSPIRISCVIREADARAGAPRGARSVRARPHPIRSGSAGDPSAHRATSLRAPWSPRSARHIVGGVRRMQHLGDASRRERRGLSVLRVVP